MAVILAALAVTVVTAVAASSASAAFELSTAKCETGPKFGVCWSANTLEEPLELVGEETITAKGGLNKFVVSGVPLEIECEEIVQGTAIANLVSQTAPLGTPANKIEGTLLEKKCKLTGTNTVAEKCLIPEEKETNELSGEATSATNVHLIPKTGSVFIEIPFTNILSPIELTCPATVAGTRKVTGAQDLTVVSSTNEQGQKTGTTVVASELLFIEKKAELTGSITVKFTEDPEDWFGQSLT